jgi:hypothetical protein
MTSKVEQADAAFSLELLAEVAQRVPQVAQMGIFQACDLEATVGQCRREVPGRR